MINVVSKLVVLLGMVRVVYGVNFTADRTGCGHCTAVLTVGVFIIGIFAVLMVADSGNFFAQYRITVIALIESSAGS